ncbi:MAG TPA: FtsX-like permease family protein [Candidatus Paceibacterota bacterium]|nr:FtsX-like permease family protein [Verrucomicrobiota bacterium]HRY50806.1 FtsX-like permease family protein [Candidatus Paceibacterota bacterium]HSA02237.1 FtsX-like permease family protein [Candidatus Paceibacterota bacterium]
MNLIHLVLREICHRKLNFSLGAVSVSLAVACLVAELAILQKHDARTEQIVSAKEAATREQMAKLEDDYRKVMLKMGFNVLILPKDQNLGDLYADDFGSKFMPEEYAARLAKSRVATINHVLPSLQQKVKWPEFERTVLLMGVRGEVYIQSAQQKPLLDAVTPGTMILGHELARTLNLKAGEKTKFMGREFAVAKVNSERGNKDDITVWISLSEAQELLGKPGLINGILALDCTCDTLNRLGRIRPEIASILPDTQVIEYASQALTRAEARQRAAIEAQASIRREKEGRDKLRAEREALAAVLVPVVILGSSVWIGLLALANVRERRGEIGILRAIGLRTPQLLFIVLAKAGIIGFCGAGAGYVAGRTIGALWHETPDSSPLGIPFMDLRLFALILAAASLVALLASWLPAVHAAQQDPAVALREE